MISFGAMTREQIALGGATLMTLAGIGVMQVAPFVRMPRFGFLRRRKVGRGVEIAREFIPDDARLRHTHIVGATGSGKTVLLEQLIYRDIERGSGALIIDPKGDRDFYERIRAFCRRVGRESDLHLLSATYSSESVRWNPCRAGNESELQSKFYNSAIYSEPHYAKACELALLNAFSRLCASGAFTLNELVLNLDEQRRREKSTAVEGLFLDLNNLVVGKWGELMGCRQGGGTEITLLDITRRNEILFVDLPTESQAIQSGRIGRLLLQEIILISGLRKLYPHLRSSQPFSVFVDEFDAFASPSFATFLNKGRSSDFMIHLAHQTLSDLDRVAPSFRGQIMGNMNVRFVFRQDGPDDAEEWSRFFGTRLAVKKTYQTQDGQNTGMSSNREVREFKASPDLIKDLRTGECIFGMKDPQIVKKLKIPYSPKIMAPQFQYPVQREAFTSQMVESRRSESLPERCSQLAELFVEQEKEKMK